MWEGWQRWAVGAIMVIFSLYCIGMTLFYSGLPETRLAALLAMIVFIGFPTYPVKKGHVKVNSMPWYDIILMLVGASCFLYSLPSTPFPSSAGGSLQPESRRTM